MIETMERGVAGRQAFEILPIVLRAGDDEFRMVHSTPQRIGWGQEDVLGMARHAVRDTRQSVSELRDTRRRIGKVDMEVRDALLKERSGQYPSLEKFWPRRVLGGLKPKLHG